MFVPLSEPKRCPTIVDAGVTGLPGENRVSVVPADQLLGEMDQAVMVTDATGTISLWNAAAERLYGWSAAEIVGRNAIDIFAPDDDGAAAAEVMERLAAGETWTGEFVLPRRDGTTITALVTDTPIFAENGELAAIIGLSRDVSELRASKQALAAAEGRFEALVDSSGDLMAVTDANGVVLVLAGPVDALLGVPARALVGTSVFELVLPADMDRARRLWSQRATTTEPMEAEDFWTQRTDGEWLCLNLKATNHLDDPAVAGIVITVRDVTDTRNRQSAGHLIGAANAALMLARTETDLFSEICRVAVAEGSYHLAWAGVVDCARPLGLRVVASAGTASGYLDALERACIGGCHRGLAQEVLETNTPSVVGDVELCLESNPLRHLALEHGHRSLAILPLRFSELDVGVLAIYSPRSNAFTEDAMSVLQTLADHIVYGIGAIRAREGHDRYRRRFEASLQATVRAIATASELRDPYTAGHQRRVAELSQAIATIVGLDEDQITGIGVAASIHDIGKLAVPAEILSKPGRLSDTEYLLVKEHARAGYDIVADIDFPWPAADMILQHHERLDGSGYPQGLRGEAISLGARIIAVADVAEAMSSHRPYRPGLGIHAALEFIRDGRGTLFWLDAVDACLQLFHHDGFTFAHSE